MQVAIICIADRDYIIDWYLFTDSVLSHFCLVEELHEGARSHVFCDKHQLLMWEEGNTITDVLYNEFLSTHPVLTIGRSIVPEGNKIDDISVLHFGQLLEDLN